ncbi:MAG: recombination protein O N-terminal domain-containing protein [Parcubacteria group bacterium]|nr:recombination protein O N-terminal domain-containing protein [Parcubacteria group bacterium]
MAEYYATEGIVLYAWERGEADRLFVLYTKELGLVHALAKGVRLEKSKLRSHLQLFSLGTLRFVNGRELFRIIDAHEQGRVRPTGNTTACFEAFGAVAAFLRRMVHGTGADGAVWKLLHGAFVSLQTGVSEQEMSALQALFRARLLYRLGYVSPYEVHPKIPRILAVSEFTPKILERATECLPLLRQMIENGVHASQM